MIQINGDLDVMIKEQNYYVGGDFGCRKKKYKYVPFYIPLARSYIRQVT